MHSSIHSSRPSLIIIIIDGYLAQATPAKIQLQVCIGIAGHNVSNSH